MTAAVPGPICHGQHIATGSKRTPLVVALADVSKVCAPDHCVYDKPLGHLRCPPILILPLPRYG